VVVLNGRMIEKLQKIYQWVVHKKFMSMYTMY
jgi:hypothetical protein